MANKKTNGRQRTCSSPVEIQVLRRGCKLDGSATTKSLCGEAIDHKSNLETHQRQQTKHQMKSTTHTRTQYEDAFTMQCDSNVSQKHIYVVLVTGNLRTIHACAMSIDFERQSDHSRVHALTSFDVVAHTVPFWHGPVNR